MQIPGRGWCLVLKPSLVLAHLSLAGNPFLAPDVWCRVFIGSREGPRTLQTWVSDVLTRNTGGRGATQQVRGPWRPDAAGGGSRERRGEGTWLLNQGAERCRANQS